MDGQTLNCLAVSYYCKVFLFTGTHDLSINNSWQWKDLSEKHSKVSSEVSSSYRLTATQTEKLLTFVLVKHHDFHPLTGGSNMSVRWLALYFGKEFVPNWNAKHRGFKVKWEELFYSLQWRMEPWILDHWNLKKPSFHSLTLCIIC